jgi:hypothetical protein
MRGKAVLLGAGSEGRRGSVFYSGCEGIGVFLWIIPYPYSSMRSSEGKFRVVVWAVVGAYVIMGVIAANRLSTDF